MTISKQIEQAIFDLLTTTFAGYSQDVTLFPFVADTGAEEVEAKLPAIQFAADPFQPEHPEGPLGYVAVRLSCRTHAQDDPDRVDLDDIFDKAVTAITAAAVGP